MRKLFFFLFTIVVIATCGVSSAVAASLVTNGDFETGNLSGWNLAGIGSGAAFNGQYYGVDAADAHSGNYGAFFGPPAGDVMTLFQILSTTPGSGYTISFWLAQDTDPSPGYTNSVSVLLGSSTAYTATGIGAQDYTFYSVYGVASTSSDILRFAFRNDAGYFSLDDVSITAGIPEPASFFLLAPVVGGLFLFRRRLCSTQQ